MFNKIKRQNLRVKERTNHLLQKEDLVHTRYSGNTFTEKEVNIVLIIILVVILMLFWIPVAEFVR